MRSQEVDRFVWVALASVSGIAYQTACRISHWIEDHHYSWREWWIDEHCWVATGLTEVQMEALKQWQQTWSLDSFQEHLSDLSLVPILPSDHTFPPLLAQIADMPCMLFVRGKLPDTRVSLSVVGSRRITSYGYLVVSEFVKSLAGEYQVPLISGGMYGVDEAVHRHCLKENGRTIVVLGHGHQQPLNYQLGRLYDEVCENGGAVISEYPPWQPALKGLFPARNRIVAGLSQGTLVVEAAERSGSHITASLATDYGRDVFVVAGPITNPYSRGAVLLANQGAWLVSQVSDIAEQLRWPIILAQESDKLGQFSQAQNQVLRSLSDRGPQSTNDLAQSVKVSPTEVLQTLTQLQLRGIVSVRRSLWGVTRRVWHNDTLS